jgi:hypothetical protein
MCSVMYSYVRSRQLEGTYSDDPSIGCWLISDMRIRRGWGSPTEIEWPYDGSAANWPPEEPAQIDQAAKPLRIFAYQRVRNFDECKKLLALGNPVSVAFQIVGEDWKSAVRGCIPMPDPKAALTDSHSVVIIGYDDDRRLLHFANSWGVGWGDGGYGFLPYSYFDHYQLESWTIADGRVTRPPTMGSGIIEQTWGIPIILPQLPCTGSNTLMRLMTSALAGHLSSSAKDSRILRNCLSVQLTEKKVTDDVLLN